MSNLVKNLVVLGILASLAGCATPTGVVKKVVSSDKGGVIYGVAGIISNEITVEEACKAISNADPRCTHYDNYEIVSVIARVGFADAAVGGIVLIDKNDPAVEYLRHPHRTGDKNAAYAKAKVVPGLLGEFLGLVSFDGDGKCTWGGMPRAGGTVCQEFGYDYHKDYTGVIYH